MKIANNGIDIMKQANLQQVQKTAQSAMKKQEKLPDEEGNRSIKRDEYIPSEKDEPIGLYSMKQDENGNPGIKFDSPESNSANKPDKQEDKSSDKPDEPDKAGEPEKEKSKSEQCVCDTGKVDRELKRLREKAERLEQQLRSASDEEAAKLQKQLAGVQSELAQKDNDNYRKSHAEFS
ncbi:MAG: hypothetical protein K2N26_00470 [Oscillospiraceae bacterium]|nr:hypothetical protein [Oscillospiraceae bacterium]